MAVTPITHLEQTIAGKTTPKTHLEQVIVKYGGGSGGGGGSTTTVQTMTASDTAATLAENVFYIWPEMAALEITCPASGGVYAFRFTSGETATELTLSGITMPDDFTVEAGRVYEINVYEGFGLAQSWEVVADE